MARHTVQFGLPQCDLGKADVEFHVWSDGDKFGTLAVSNGSLVWFPRDVSNGLRCTWEQFHALVTKNVQATEKRK